MPDSTERALAGGHVMRWTIATRRQADRVNAERGGPTSTAEIEAALFAIALRNLIRAAEYARQFEPERIGVAIKAFDASVPHARDVRNVLEHFDDYERGRGRLQRGAADVGLIDWHEDDGQEYRLVLVVGGQELVLDVNGAHGAAENLAGQVLTALHGE